MTTATRISVTAAIVPTLATKVMSLSRSDERRIPLHVGSLSLATKWRRNLTGGESPRKVRGKDSRALNGRRSMPPLNSSVAPSGLDGRPCHETEGFRPRLNPIAASRLKKLHHQKKAHHQKWRVGLVAALILVVLEFAGRNHLQAAESKTKPTTTATSEAAKSFLFGKPLQDALVQKVGRAWSGVTLRDVVRNLSHENKVAILLDRRIDPTRLIGLSLPPTPLRDVIAELAQSVGAQTAIIGNVVYIGPEDSAGKLRTLIDLRAKELAKLAAGAKVTSKDAKDKSAWRGRPASLTQPKSFVWEDLDRPRDLLKQVADKFQFEIDDLSNLPHDLWAGSGMPQVTAVEALSLLLIQFDATFEFHSDKAAVRVVPIPADLALTRPASTKIAKPSGTSDKKGKTASLSQTTFTLTAMPASLRDLIRTFEASGVRFDYDPVELGLAGISLEQKVDLKVEQETAKKVFKDLFEPLGIEVTIVDDVVRLRPKKTD
jgi:hypothetical protein